MGICSEIRKLMIDKDITLTELARVISKKKNKHYTIQNLSQKLRNNTLNAAEIEIIVSELGYRVYFYSTNKKNS